VVAAIDDQTAARYGPLPLDRRKLAGTKAMQYGENFVGPGRVNCILGTAGKPKWKSRFFKKYTLTDWEPKMKYRATGGWV
jgi:hypothetical protein